MNPNEASGNKSINITTLGTTTILPAANPRGKLVLLSVIVGTKGGSSNTAKIYDSATTEENLKSTLDTVNTLGAVAYNLPFYNGIRIVTAVGTPADLTIVYAETP